jgi:anthranilate synthase component I
MSELHLQPTFATFQELSTQGNLVPVWAEIAADYETPLSAYQKIRDGQCSFLFESAELTQHSGRYSLLGTAPRTLITARGREIEIDERGQKRQLTVTGDPMEVLEELMRPYRPPTNPALPVFHGGAVGYLAYDMVRYFEPTLPPPPPDQLGLPDMVFFITDVVLIFDHRTRRLSIVANVHTDEHPSLEVAYAWAQQQIRHIIEKLQQPLAVKPLQTIAPVSTEQIPAPISNTTQAEYEAMVERAKDYIGAGDIFQVVPSQRFQTDYSGSPLDLFRALRHVNPSPYMFCVELPQGFALVGSSPEVHVKCLDGNIEIRPIAGTRWRGKTVDEDNALAAEMLADPKERAEHIMLVDLARNDVGRAAQYGTVTVNELMIVERYSHVMHIVSNVTGQLRPDRTAYDVMRATFRGISSVGRALQWH